MYYIKSCAAHNFLYQSLLLQPDLKGMTRKSLTLEEQLSPIRFPSLELFNSEGKENTVALPPVEATILDLENNNHARIYPHGLKPKHEARRNTIHQAITDKTPAKKAQRFALTSPRLVIPTLFPPDTEDNVTGSPLYGIRSKRLSSATNFSIDKYLNRLGKGISVHQNIESDGDEFSPIKKHRGPIQSSEQGLGNNIEINKTSLLGSDKLIALQEIATSPTAKSSKNSCSNDGQSEDIKTKSHNPPQDIVRIDNEDLSIVLGESPESKRLFSRRYINKVQNKFRDEVKKLEIEIASKNDLLSDLLIRVSEQERINLKLEQDLNLQRREAVNLQFEIDALNVNLREVVIDLARAIKKLKRKDSLLYMVNEKLDHSKKRIEENHINASHQIVEMEEAVERFKRELALKQTLLDELKIELGDAQEVLGMDLSGNYSIKQKIIELCSENDQIKSELQMVSSKNIELSSLVSELEEAKQKSELAREDLNDKFLGLMEETKKVQEEMTTFETIHKRLENDISEKESQIKDYSLELESVRNEKSAMEESFKSSEVAKLLAFQKEKQDLLQQINTLQKQNEEKDQIISGDTKKLSQLVEELGKQKLLLSTLTTSPEQASAQNTELLRQIANLKRQISHAQLKTEERIQEVAEQLFHQYSKKHELKVNQLKEKYEAKLQEKTKQINLSARQLESLESRLNMGEKEKNYLLQLLEKTNSPK